ncbi:MAG: DMT family transporter [Ignavibacteria bacterium]
MKQNSDISNPEKNLFTVYKAELFLLFVTLSWGLSFPLIKLTLEYVSPVLFNFIRFALTLILFIIIFYKKIRHIKFGDLRYGIILGVFMILGFVFQTIGLQYTTASKSAFITGTNLIFIPFIQFIILKSKPKYFNLISALIVLTGLFILSESFEIVPNVGDILTIICAFFFAVHIVLLDKYSAKSDVNFLIFGQFLISTVICLVFAFFYEHLILDETKFSVTPILLITLFFTVVFSTLIGIVFMTKFQRLTTPLKAGIIYNMESIFALIFAYFILNEIMNSNQIIGAIIMLIGLIFSEIFGIINFKNLIGKKN